MKDMTLDELASFLEKAHPSSVNHAQIMSELNRRQTRAQLEATAAQIEAAQAAKETARYTKDVARYMFWSVLAVAASAVIALLSFAVNVWL